MTKEDYDILIRYIYLATITEYNLPEQLYLFTANKLFGGVQSGYGVQFDKVKFMSPDWETLNTLKTDVYNFSGAKTFTQVRELQTLMFDEQGFKISFDKYKVEAKETLHTYNEVYLKTEYEHSYSAANSVKEWENIQASKKSLPFLTYQTIKDQRVREEHQQLDGITRKVDDKFWDSYFPPNGWNCRCYVIQDFEGTETKTQKIKEKTKDIELDPYFNRNFGKQRVIFPKSHPYYNVGDDYAEFKKNNFGLKIPK